jgi:hypothetical protein
MEFITSAVKRQRPAPAMRKDKTALRIRVEALAPGQQIETTDVPDANAKRRVSAMVSSINREQGVRLRTFSLEDGRLVIEDIRRQRAART